MIFLVRPLILSLALTGLLTQCSTTRWSNARAASSGKEPAISYTKPRLWNKQHLTWQIDGHITSLPSGLTRDALCREVEKSFTSWARAGVFTFSQAAPGQTADITITFDPPPGRLWDGQLGTMGHAAFPWAANRGRIYLDPSEWWSGGSFSLLGDPITQWLPHEIGHVLGLQHTHRSGDMMCATGPYELPDDGTFSQLRHLYDPITPVIAWSSFSTAASTKRRTVEQPMQQ